MLKTRVIPVLQLNNDYLIKTVKFEKFDYIGDPINTVRIFNEMEVDELVFLDIKATREEREPPYHVLREIADECFMPLAYGGGISSLEHAKKIFNIGIEKIIVNSHSFVDVSLISRIAEVYGNQSIILSIDVRRNFFGNYEMYSINGTTRIKRDPVEWARQMEEVGIGEILITSMDRDGTWCGYDLEITKKIAGAVTTPVIVNGGAGKLADFSLAVDICDVSAVAAGSMFVYQKQDMGVLINYPTREELTSVL